MANNAGRIGQINFPTTSSANGIWSVDDQYNAKKSSLWPIPPGIITTSLIFNIDAANSSSYPGSGSTWYDLSGSGNHVTLLNSPTYNASGWLTFNGTSQTGYVTKPNPNPAGNISCEFWYYDTRATNTILMHKGYHYTTYFTDQNTFYWADSTYSYASFGARTITNINQINVWKHIVVTKDSANDVKIYKNGTLQDTRLNFSPAITQYANSTMFITGYSNDDTVPTGYLLQGNIAIMRMYNIALSASEVLNNFNVDKTRFGL